MNVEQQHTIQYGAVVFVVPHFLYRRHCFSMHWQTQMHLKYKHIQIDCNTSKCNINIS